MRTQTRIDYAGRIERVVARIGQATDDETIPSADELAGVAALSPFHFQRIFRLMTGESVGDLVRRARLARSLATLRDTAATITDASGAAGYATSQAYARAIRAVTGTTASAVRDTPEALDEIARQLASASAVAAAPLTIQIVSAAPMRLHVLRNVGAYAELNQVFERLFERVFTDLPITALVGVHGLFDDDPRSVDAAALRFSCALELAAVADPGGPTIDVAAGRYLRVRHVGDYDALLDAIDGLTAVAVSAGLELGDAPPRVHYIDTPDDAPAERLRSDIYLPLAAPRDSRRKNADGRR